MDFLPPLQIALRNGETQTPHPFEEGVRQVLTKGIGLLQANPPFFGPPFWRHLMYAYLIENTRIVEILQKLMVDGLHDERFGTFTEATHRWLRTTEELFFRTSSAYFFSPVTSALRPDSRATRRNAYQRMFGMDLNHGAADGGAYPYIKAQAANLDFVKVLQELLRELWRGFSNAQNTAGPHATDVSNILELLNRLKTQLNARRLSVGNHANLLREEFDAVAFMSWFEVSISPGAPLILDLKAEGTVPEEVLRKLSAQAQIGVHGKARNLFILARDLPALLRSVELGVFDTAADAENLYKNPGNTLEAVLRIVNHWSIATGVDLKSLPVAPVAR